MKGVLNPVDGEPSFPTLRSAGALADGGELMAVWLTQNELMTPTFKLKRPQLQKKYQGVIDAMYKQLNSKR